MIKTATLLAAMLIVWGCGSDKPATDAGPDDTAKAVDITFLHTNDVHARVKQFNRFGECTAQDIADNFCFGGAARRATAIDAVRAAVDNVLVIDAGDQFQGTLFHTHWQGEETWRTMNMLGYDVMAIGNHEFDHGPERLATFIDNANFPVISANIDVTTEPTLSGKIPGFHVFEFEGEKVGVFGLTTEETALASSPGANVVFRDRVTVATEMVAMFESMGINKIVAVSHSGLTEDTDIATSVAGIDVFISGHSHQLLSNSDGDAIGPYPRVVTSPRDETVLLVSGGANGTHLGQLSVSFDKNGVVTSSSGDATVLDTTVAEKPTVLTEVTALEAPLQALYAQVVGVANVDIDGTRDSCRFLECTMGNVVADAMLLATTAQSTQIALQNGGGIRSGLTAGNVSVANVFEVLPFGDTLATVELTGDKLLSVLENGVSRADAGSTGGTGRFLQVAGLRFAFDPAANPGSRVSGVEIKTSTGFEPLSLTTTYKIVTTSFIRQGGDGFSDLADGMNPLDFGTNVDEALRAYIEAETSESGGLSPAIEGRITVISPS